MPDQLGQPCVEHDPKHCACDERRDREAGVHRASGLDNGFGGYECVCGAIVWRHCQRRGSDDRGGRPCLT